MNAPNNSEDGGNSLPVYSIPYTLKLKHPFPWGTEQKSEVIFARRLKGKDMKGIQTSAIKMDDMMMMLSRITGEAPAVIQELDTEDLFEAIGVLNSFLPSGQMTGDK